MEFNTPTQQEYDEMQAAMELNGWTKVPNSTLMTHPTMPISPISLTVIIQLRNILPPLELPLKEATNELT